MDTHITPPTILLRWSARTTPVHERSRLWYVLASAVTIAVLGYGLYAGDWSVVLVVALIAIVIFLFRNYTPSEKEISLTEKGFTFKEHFTAWDDCRDFWIVKTPSYAELHILRKGHGLHREVVIQTGNVETSVIREIAAQFLPERSDQGERLLDTIIRICKL